MPTTEALIVMSICALLAIATLGFIWAWSWKGWLGLKHHELEATGGQHRPTAEPMIGNRIELADLRERVRKLEAIAAGVEL